MTTIARNIISADSVAGTEVRNLENEKLGSIEDTMLDLGQGSVAYMVLSFGGFLGFGDKLFAVPAEALTYDARSECYRLNVSKEKLEKAPGFNKDHWPNSSDPYWADGLHEFYGVPMRTHG